MRRMGNGCAGSRRRAIRAYGPDIENLPRVLEPGD